jgi:hypothetical protein
VGLLDGDIYGPSLPTMLGLDALEQEVTDGELQPFAVHGIKAMTIGKLVEADKPLIWRGPMAHGAFKQLATQTEWGELDYLIIDLPPGHGRCAADDGADAAADRRGRRLHARRRWPRTTRCGRCGCSSSSASRCWASSRT